MSVGMTSEVVWANQSRDRDPIHLRYIQELVDIAARRAVITARSDESSTFGITCSLGCQHWSRRFEWPWAMEIASVTSRDVVLEAGGGETEFQFLLAKYAKRVVNFDQDQGSLDSSELFARELGLRNLLFRRGDLTSIYYPDAYFDKVFCTSVVEHIEQAEVCIDELWRVLKPGGQFIFTMDVIECGRAASGPGGTYLFGLKRAASLLERWGLELPVFPSDGLKQPLAVTGPDSDEVLMNYLQVLCVQIVKTA